MDSKVYNIVLNRTINIIIIMKEVKYYDKYLSIYQTQFMLKMYGTIALISYTSPISDILNLLNFLKNNNYIKVLAFRFF